MGKSWFVSSLKKNIQAAFKYGFKSVNTVCEGRECSE